MHDPFKIGKKERYLQGEQVYNLNQYGKNLSYWRLF